MIESYRKIFSESKSRFIEEWQQFLRFKSISADSAYSADCESCCSWVADHLTGLGFKVEILRGEGKPIVWAERAGNPLKRTVLFYGHYDVQPVDPLELWKSPPFEPEQRNGRLYARGAQDNKGQLFYVLKAIEALIAENSLHAPMKVIIEGEEETGSGFLTETLPKIKDRLKADVLMVCDTGTLHQSLATITMGLRGIISCEVRLKGPNYDLHSGVHGGLVKNPATEIARLVATLHDSDGRIAIKDYYRDIAPVSEADKELANRAPYELERYEEAVGMRPDGGEAGFTVAERRGFRPTVEINGIYGGFAGEGGKTIIPSVAGVKITSRLVSGQDPAWCLNALVEHLRQHTPAGLKFEVVYQEVGGRAVSLGAHSETIAAARQVLDQVSDHHTILMWEGASIPIVAELSEISGADPLLVGFGLEEDLIHAPNESFSLEQFEKGFLYSTMLLKTLSE